jgi:hypothetical protein
LNENSFNEQILDRNKLFTTSIRIIPGAQWTKGPTQMKGSIGPVPLRVTEVYWVATMETWVSFQGNSKSHSKKYLSPTQKVRNEPLKANNNNEVLMENNVTTYCAWPGIDSENASTIVAVTSRSNNRYSLTINT